jgi:hypothetical protein
MWHGGNQYTMTVDLAKYFGHCPCVAAMACYTEAAYNPEPEKGFSYHAK